MPSRSVPNLTRRPLGASVLAWCFLQGAALAAGRVEPQAGPPDAQPLASPGSGGSEPAGPGVDALLRDPRSLARWLRDNNRDILGAAARARQAEADSAQSRLIPNPSLAASFGDVPVGQTNPPGLTHADTTITTTTLAETVEIGKRGPRIRSADLRLQSGRESYLGLLGEKVGEARSILGRIAFLKAREGVLEGSLETARQILELQRARLDNGDLSGSDFDRLLIDTMVLESDVARTRSELDEALSSCRAILYAPCAPPQVEIGALAALAEVPGAPDLELALAARPDLRAVDLEKDSAEQDALLARRRAIPDPNLAVGYTHDNLTISGDQPNTLSFSVMFPLPLFDRGQHDAQKARQRAEELRQQASAGRVQARSDIEGLLRRKGFLEATLGTLQNEAIPRSKSVLDATVTAVTQGEMSMTDLLLARRTHTELLLKVMDLQFDSFSVRNDLRRALGLDADVARSVLGT
jgi:outer membrane protein, heavy metal efflux system